MTCDLFVLEEGRRVAREIVREAPAFDYYVRRVELVLRLAGEKSGSEQKKQQYLTREYAETPRGSRIASISDQARGRLASIRQELQEQGAGEHEHGAD
ncbi:hypothetical protein [Streptomyces sp. NBC_00134]|uniref:hypothetical protein n=1 Tax=Streptomyces sp. NBC_00134 TaxID=2975663 RepID=UPI0032535DFC